MGDVKRSGVIAVAALGALLAGLLVYGVAGRGGDRTLDRKVADGERPPAPDHALPLLDGRGRQSLASYRGKVVFLNFFASWCQPCAVEAPTLRAFQASLRRSGSDATLLGVTYKNYAPNARRFMRTHGLTYPSLNDDKLQLASLYGTVALPETFVVDRRGRLVAISRGIVTRRFLDASLKRALRS
jgi:cytochrome c biogenesis protein CcmG/thiol:disulfide interchange protein DsbE